MSVLTLTQAGYLSNDVLVQGVIENIVTTNPIYDVLPFQQIQGNSLAYNRESTLGDVQYLAHGGTITAKTPTVVTPASSKLVTLIGDAETEHYDATVLSDVNDQRAIQIAGKAKSIGRQYQDSMVNGDTGVDANSFDGLLKSIPAGQTYDNTTSGLAFDFPVLDNLIRRVKSKDGQVDAFMMNSAYIDVYLAKLRALGGASINEVITLPSGRQLHVYRGIPIFPNDWIPTNMTAGGQNTASAIFAMNFDDGTKKVGVAGLTSVVNSGVFVTPVGESETKNMLIDRVRFYCSMAIFSLLGVAMATGIRQS